MSISPVARSVLAIAVGVAAIGVTNHAREPRATVAARPPVALRLRIDAQHYRQILQDSQCVQKCRDLQQALTDTLRPLLQRTYAFLDWNTTTGGVADTIEIRLIDRPPREVPGSRLDFSIRSRPNTPRMTKASYPVDFESFVDISKRMGTPERWHPDSMRREWAGRMHPLLQQPDLLLEVFGRIPIAAGVTFRDRGRAVVGVRASEIGAGEGVRPAFRVRLEVTDPARGTEDDADLILAGCQPASGAQGYACDTRQLQYVAQQPLGLDSTIAVLARSTKVPNGVYVIEYATAGQPSRFNGAVLPGALP